MVKTVILTHTKLIEYKDNMSHYSTFGLINIIPIYNLDKNYKLLDDDLPEDIKVEILEDIPNKPVKLTYDPDLYFVTLCVERRCEYNPFILFHEYYFNAEDDGVGIPDINIQKFKKQVIRTSSYHTEFGDNEFVAYKSYIPVQNRIFKCNFRMFDIEEELENGL